MNQNAAMSVNHHADRGGGQEPLMFLRMGGSRPPAVAVRAIRIAFPCARKALRFLIPYAIEFNVLDVRRIEIDVYQKLVALNRPCRGNGHLRRERCPAAVPSIECHQDGCDGAAGRIDAEDHRAEFSCSTPIARQWGAWSWLLTRNQCWQRRRSADTARHQRGHATPQQRYNEYEKKDPQQFLITAHRIFSYLAEYSTNQTRHRRI